MLWDIMKELRNYQFTAYKERSVNDVIRKHLKFIVQEILRNIDDVVAILLNGGFGKGEGSVKRVNNHVIPLNDYDIVVITRRPHKSSSFHSDILDNFAESLGIHLDIDLFWMPLLRFVSKRLFWYDVKFGSKVIYGDEKAIRFIPINYGDNPPPDEGLRLLFHRMAGLIEFFDPLYIEDGCNQRQSELIIYNSIKAILACCESLLILAHRWHTSCRERCHTFSMCYRNDFPKLAYIIPDLPDAVAEACLFRLYPSFELFPDPISLWFKAREYMRQIILYYWNKLHETNISNETELLSDMIRKSRFAIMDYAIYHIRYLMRRRKLSFKGLATKKRFLDYLFVATFLLMTSIDENGSISIDSLMTSLKFVNNLLSTKVSPVNTSKRLWCFTRDGIFEDLKYVRR